MRNETVGEVAGLRVVLMDTISAIAEADAGAVVVCGSHGGAISGAFARLHPPALVLFNDAGGGKADGGRAAVALLDEAGIPCATVGHLSARIGDARDAWENGTVSAAGELARARGVDIGQTVRSAVAMFGESGAGAAGPSRTAPV